MNDYSYMLKKIGGYSLIVAGVLAAIALSFHPDEFIPGSLLLDKWRPVHLVLLFAFTISIFGVVGIFISLPDKANLVSIIAYILGIVGCAWSAVIVVLEVFVLPVLASQATQQVPLMDMMSPTTPFSLLGKFFMTAVLIWILAWVLIGIVLLRSIICKPYVGTFIIVASVAIAFPTHFAGGFSGILKVIFAFLFGISWVLLGNALLKVKNPTTEHGHN